MHFSVNCSLRLVVSLLVSHGIGATEVGQSGHDLRRGLHGAKQELRQGFTGSFIFHQSHARARAHTLASFLSRTFEIRSDINFIVCYFRVCFMHGIMNLCIFFFFDILLVDFLV